MLSCNELAYACTTEMRQESEARLREIMDMGDFTLEPAQKEFADLRSWNPVEASATPYAITTYQSQYFVSDRYEYSPCH